jgi:hypothetical protein
MFVVIWIYHQKLPPTLSLIEEPAFVRDPEIIFEHKPNSFFKVLLKNKKTYK